MLAVDTMPAGTAPADGEDDAWGEEGSVQPVVTMSIASDESMKRGVR